MTPSIAAPGPVSVMIAGYTAVPRRSRQVRGRARAYRGRPMEERYSDMAGSAVFWLALKFVILGPLLRLMFRPRVSGLENIPPSGGAILAANHVSFLDPLL